MDSHNLPDHPYAALCESEQRYRGLVELSPAPIVVQSDGRVVFINRAGVRLLGADVPAELIGLPVLDFVHSDYYDITAAHICQAQAQQPLGDRIEAALIRLDGQLIDVEVVGIPMTYRGEPATQMVISDITARKRLEAERLAAERRLLEAQKIESLGVLAGGIAHDFNNLLMGVLGNAALARMDLPPGSPAEYSIGQIEAAASRAADLTRQMLAYSGRGRLMMQSIDVNTLVEETSALAQAAFSRAVVIELCLGAALPSIEADSGQMRQLLMSLLVNAGEAIGDGPGAITISTGARQITSAYLATTYLTPDLPSGQYVYLEVADTGRGMDAGTLARIFEPYFTTKFTGRGLELAALLGVVRSQRGALAVRSEPECGSVFTIWLPGAAHRQPEGAAPPSERPASARAAVLVVEDND